MTKVYAPDRTFSGPGAGGAVFRDGVAHVTSESLLTYFRDAGYGIDKPPPPPPGAPSADARDYAQPIMLGTPLRDAAVDPRDDDFLAPTNAGEADPHGPLVVSPEIHGTGPAGIRPGKVYVEDMKKQDDAETALAQAVLVDQKTHDEAHADPAVVADPFAEPDKPEPLLTRERTARPAKSSSRKSSSRKSTRG